MTDPTRPTRFSRLVGAVRYLVGVAAATTVILLFTLGDDSRPDPGGAGPGREIYAAQCAVCHGPGGEGGTGPPLGPDMAAKYPDPATQELIVARGVNSMIGFETRLTPDEISAVVAYTRRELASGG